MERGFQRLLTIGKIVIILVFQPALAMTNVALIVQSIPLNFSHTLNCFPEAL